MIHVVRLAAVIALFIGGLTGCSTGQAGSSAPSSASADAGITVIVIKDEVDDDDQTQQIPTNYRFPSPATVAAAQSEINSNAKIRSVLQSKSIQLRNVVGVQTAANGGKIIYVQ